MSEKTISFEPLSPEVLEEFADARNFVAGLAVKLAGGSLHQSEADFPILQAIVEHEAMRHANHGAWVAVGIAFGDALAAHVPGLAWCLVTDESGTYATLQYRSKVVSVAASTMLWKRVDRGEEMDLMFMAKEIGKLLAENAHTYEDA